ncbi:hypothetical protein GQ53DRAFT_518938 [Thozetella sp. PMI_491]|nr:hypothetical protein GQ53DRAFT_518938 [Thozetella sp. PMI_491]
MMATLVRSSLRVGAGSSMSRPLKAALRPWDFPRTVTNATRPDYVQSLQSLRKGTERDGGWHQTLVHSSGDLKWTVIRLKPGHGEVPAHFHTKVWDYFIPLSGKAVIETKTKEGAEKNYEMLPDTFLSVPAGDLHRVRNASESEEFVFLLAQSPRSMYDYIRSKDPMTKED